jgi:hypothetical protein
MVLRVVPVLVMVPSSEIGLECSWFMQCDETKSGRGAGIGGGERARGVPAGGTLN